MTKLFAWAFLLATASAHMAKQIHRVRDTTAVSVIESNSDNSNNGGNSNSNSNSKSNSNSGSSSSGSTTISIGITIIGTNSGGGSSTSWSNTSSAGTGTVHQVTVGGSAGLVYTPDSITAAVGDFVQFNFMSANHTATQSSFNTPCVAMANGLDTGFVPNPNNTISPPPSQMFQITTTDPIWMYCKQKGHCGKGMVFSINPTAQKSQAIFQAAAIAQNGTSTSSSSGSASSAAAAAVATASVASGSGTSSSGACTCACLCGVGSWPSNVGVGAFGGLSGTISAAAVQPMSRKRGLHGAHLLS